MFPIASFDDCRISTRMSFSTAPAGRVAVGTPVLENSVPTDATVGTVVVTPPPAGPGGPEDANSIQNVGE